MGDRPEDASSVCQYCAHRNGEGDARCTHCGAPLRARVRDAVEQVERRAAQAVQETERALEHGAKSALEHGSAFEKFIARQSRLRQWLLVWAAVAALVVLLLVFGARSCSTQLLQAPDFGVGAAGSASSAVVLPPELSGESSCAAANDGTGGQKCVIAPNSGLLAGGLTGGKELTFYAEQPGADRLADAVRKWRSAGGTVLADGEVFVAIGSTQTVRYADMASGLRVETGAFTGPAAVRTFLARSGLAM